MYPLQRSRALKLAWVSRGPWLGWSIETLQNSQKLLLSWTLSLWIWFSEPKAQPESCTFKKQLQVVLKFGTYQAGLSVASFDSSFSQSRDLVKFCTYLQSFLLLNLLFNVLGIWLQRWTDHSACLEKHPCSERHEIKYPTWRSKC